MELVIQEDNKIKDETVDLQNLMDFVNNKLENNENNENSEYEAQKLYYDLNYTVSEIKLFLKYYDISYRKMKKENMIQCLVLFEMNKDNESIVSMRKQMWFYLKELQSDSFFKQFVLIN